MSESSWTFSISVYDVWPEHWSPKVVLMSWTFYSFLVTTGIVDTRYNNYVEALSFMHDNSTVIYHSTFLIYQSDI